jgi:hypothetical protein
MKRKIKHELAGAALLSIATTMCDLENIIDDYPQYATISGADSDSAFRERRYVRAQF